MRYLILIYVDPATYGDASEADNQAEMAEYFALSNMLREKGHYVAAEALQGIETATTVRVRDGKVLATDGPFAETKEHLGGFYLVDADNLDQALEIAAAIPDSRRGSIEVRPVVDFG